MEPEAAIVSYMQTVRNSTFSQPLILSDWYSLFPHEEGCTETLYKWPAKFPNAGKPGIYFIFDSNMSLLYVGMTTRDLNGRLGNYFGYISGRGSGCRINEKMLPPWKTRPYYVRTLPLENASEAPSLERFLIDTLRPPDNSK